LKLFLIGMMGSGKSYWSKILAHQLNLSPFDLDTVAETSAGKTIAQIFEQDGEAFFRAKETEALHSFQPLNNCIIATGGGTPCFNNNMQWMNDHGTTIWLNEPIDLLAERLKKEKEHRPLIKHLSNENLIDFLQQKLVERTPFYCQSQLHLSSQELATANLHELLNN
jgi:shikimate kinase